MTLQRAAPFLDGKHRPPPERGGNCADKRKRLLQCENHCDVRNAAVLPPEVVAVLRRNSCSTADLGRWYAIPSNASCYMSLPLALVKQDGCVEIDTLLEDMLDDPRLIGTLRSMDLLNGCFNHCDTCLADAPYPSKIISLASLQRMFRDSRFLAMLQPDSLRFGSCGDILDHPDALEIVQLVLEATKALDAKRRQMEGKPHTLKVYINYRPAKEPYLDELIELMERSNQRLVLVVSLPLNRGKRLNLPFLRYVAARPRYFGISHETHEDGFPVIQGAMKFGSLPARDGQLSDRPKIAVWDLSHPDWLVMTGRVLAHDCLRNRVHPSRCLKRFRELEVEQRGFVKTYLNADGLWLMIYGTAYESHTSRIYTQLTRENIYYLSTLPYHPDFPTPPRWPGGRGERRVFSDLEVREKENEYKQAGRVMKARSITHG